MKCSFAKISHSRLGGKTPTALLAPKRRALVVASDFGKGDAMLLFSTQVR
jgi:hypothetical protein